MNTKETEKAPVEENIPVKTFYFKVEYFDSQRPGQKITEFMAIDGETEHDTMSKAAVGTTFRAAQRLYHGNQAFFSNVSAKSLSPLELSAENPRYRNENGQPKKLREICLENKLVWGETSLWKPEDKI